MADKTKPKSSSFGRRILQRLTGRGTSSNVEELEGRLLALVRSLPICGQTPWKLRELEGLLQKGAPVCARSELWQDYTALHFACRNVDFPTAKLLIQYGADVKARGSDRSTPLHVAVYRSPGRNLIQLLHEHGADLNALNCCGETPLHLAATSQLTSNARTLISLGANPLCCTYECGGMACPKDRMRTPLGHSLTSGRLELILLFLQYGDSFEDYDISTLAYVYSRCMNLEIVRLLVEAGLKIPWDLFEGEKRQTFKNWPDNFIEWLANPRSLQLQCMRIIRHCVGKKNLERLADLHLPAKLKDRLIFKLESIGVKNTVDKCVDKGGIKTNRGLNAFNVYEHAMPCSCI
jgi:hypothetical protein